MKRLAGVLFVTVALLAPARANASTTPSKLGASDLKVVSSKQLNARVRDYVFESPAFDGRSSVRVLLPKGYDISGATRYPVLYLLHGGFGGYKDWTEKGNAESVTAGFPFIVVMSECGGDGNYADWYNNGRAGKPMWETYHINQLVPWVDAHLPTIAERGRRAIAGLSMGGGGASGLAAKHPDLFGAVGVFSGAVDTNAVPVQALAESSGWSQFKPPGAVFGHRALQEVRWRGANPYDLAVNLQHMFLQLDTGSGFPGGPGRDTGDPVEGAVHQMMRNFHKQLALFEIPHIWNSYGQGGHNWFYWQRDLVELLPRLRQVWAQPIAAVRDFEFKTILPRFNVYDWHVAIARRATEFAQLSVRPDGFSLRGSGSASVTTAPNYAPGSTLRVVTDDADGHRVRDIIADAAGRVRVPVSLGAANPFQQYTPRANAWMAATTGRAVWPSRTAAVVITAA